LADRVLEIVTLDVASFKATRRALEMLALIDVEPRVDFIVNRARRGEIAPADVSRVFGAEPLSVIPFDGAVPRAQDRGQLLIRRGRVARIFERLASQMLEPGADAA
jgi:Flp pilus assembly CpaE family ATPase